MFTYTYVCTVEKYPCEMWSYGFSSSRDDCTATTTTTTTTTRGVAVAECYKEGCHANMDWCKKSVTCLSQFVLTPPQINENIYFSLNQFTHPLYVSCVSLGCHEVAQENFVFCFKSGKWV
jgi:hypothetical protein